MFLHWNFSNTLCSIWASAVCVCLFTEQRRRVLSHLAQLCGAHGRKPTLQRKKNFILKLQDFLWAACWERTDDKDYRGNVAVFQERLTICMAWKRKSVAFFLKNENRVTIQRRKPETEKRFANPTLLELFVERMHEYQKMYVSIVSLQLIKFSSNEHPHPASTQIKKPNITSTQDPLLCFFPGSTPHLSNATLS